MKMLVRAPAKTGSGLLQAIPFGILAALPTSARAQHHGGTIQKTCLPSQVQPDETLTCTIRVTNTDTFRDSLRIDAIVDKVCHGGSTCPAVKAQCPGAAHVG